MKKTAVLIYDQFCLYEMSVALEMLSMAGKPITVFAKTLAPIRSEEGLLASPDAAIDALDISAYDSLLLTGSADLREAAEDEAVVAFVRRFDRPDIVIGAISIAPMLLLKAGMLQGKRFMMGVNQADVLEEGFTPEDVRHMIGWDDSLQSPVEEGYIQDGNIITSVSYGFLKWAEAFCRALKLEVDPLAFGADA